MTTVTTTRAIGIPLDRIDGPLKVRGAATYAYEQPVDRPAYLYPIESTIAAGRITGVDTSAATAEAGVLAVLTHENAPKLASTDDAELAILQSDEVAYRGQLIGGVVAETSEIARHAASLVRMEYEELPHDVELRSDRTDLYAPERVNAGFATDTAEGDVDVALASAVHVLDATYTTPTEHNNPSRSGRTTGSPSTAPAKAYTRLGRASLRCSTSIRSVFR
jgi:xanthine dehydrogenase YagR molybdenum-binding subunit